MNAVMPEPASAHDADAIFEWCAQYIAQWLTLDWRRITRSDSLDALGLDSASATSMVIELEEQFGVEVPLAFVFGEPTLGDIAARVAEQIAGAATGGRAA
jgi:acyl carrier protein